MIKIRIQEFLIETFQTIRGYFLNWFHRFDYDKLSRLRIGQKEKFDLFKKDFPNFYKSLGYYDNNKDTAENFKKVLARIEKAFFPNPKFSFLTNPTIKYVMLFTRGGNSLIKRTCFFRTQIPRPKITGAFIGRFCRPSPLDEFKIFNFS